MGTIVHTNQVAYVEEVYIPEVPAGFAWVPENPGQRIEADLLPGAPANPMPGDIYNGWTYIEVKEAIGDIIPAEYNWELGTGIQSSLEGVPNPTDPGVKAMGYIWTQITERVPAKAFYHVKEVGTDLPKARYDVTASNKDAQRSLAIERTAWMLINPEPQPAPEPSPDIWS